jgi:hypothetical protein
MEQILYTSAHTVYMGVSVHVCLLQHKLVDLEHNYMIFSHRQHKLSVYELYNFLFALNHFF